MPAAPGERPLVPVHPEPVAGDPQALRWVMPAGTLGFVGAPAAVPDALQRLLDDGPLASLDVEPAAVRLRLRDGESWSEHGATVRTVLAAALGVPEAWRAAGGAAPDDARLRLAVEQVLDGDVGDYIRSHGGRVALLEAHEGRVEVELSGACSHCPASDTTLSARLETGIRALYPGLASLTARDQPGAVPGRGLLRLLPTRRR